MATKKYLSLERLTEYDGLIKNEIAEGDAATLASAKSYTDTEVAKKAAKTHDHAISDVTNLQTTIDTINSEVNGSIKELSVSGKTITYTKNDGSTGTITTQDTNTDTKVTNTLATTTKAYVTGTTSATTSTGTQVFDTGVYLDTTAGKLTATTFKGALEGNASSATSAKGISTSDVLNITAGSTIYETRGATTSHIFKKGEAENARFDTSGNLVPGTDSTYNIGSTEKAWKNVYADTFTGALSGNASSATKATQDGSGNTITSTYETKSAATSKLAEAKTYADTAASTAAAAVKNDLLNGAGEAYDTLKELGDLIGDNADAIDALETVAAGKADKSHTHAISDVSDLQSALDGKAAASHGTHVSFDSTNKPKMDGTAAFGTSTKVARADHVHPTDTSRASKTEFDTHVADTTKHITSTERTNWGAAYTHSQTAHAPSNAQANQNAFSNIKVGETTIAADTTTDTLELVGSNVTITPDATNDKITIAVASGSTSAKGVVQLTNSTSSTSTTTAATPSAVKSAYDLANTAKTAAATAQTAADAAQADADAAIKELSVSGKVITYTKNDGTTGTITTQDTNTTYTNASLGQGYATCTTEEATTAKVGTLSSYSLQTGGIVSVKFSYAVPASATLNINSKGAKSIYYRGAAITAGVIEAGDVATFIYSGQYHLIAIDRWQSDLTSLQTAVDGKAASGHTHSAATTSANGFMTKDMVTKLNGIATGANKTTVDSELSSTSTNPVQNKAVNSAITSLTTTVSVNTSAISANTTSISTLRSEMDNIVEITSAEISALFA